MFLQKKTGGTSVDGHAWEDDGDIVEVPDALGHELAALAPSEYTQVDGPKGAKARSSRPEKGE